MERPRLFTLPKMTVKLELVLFLLMTLMCWTISAKDDENNTKFKCPRNAPNFYPCNCTKGGENGIFLLCENTNLASMSLGLSNVRIPIEELRLHRCNIKKLHGSVFEDLSLKKLIIEDTPVQHMTDDIFEPLGNTLTHLHLLDAGLNEFPSEALKALKILEVLEVRGANITKLTQGLVPNLPNLKELRLNYCGIESMAKNALQGMRKLESIDFHHNELKEIPAGAFKNKRDARMLDLSHNNFVKLDSRYFSDLSKLTWCNMSHNAIQNFGQNPFARNSVLGWLSLAHNLLKKIDRTTFRSMRFMRRLFLNDNQISQIGRGAFGSMKRIGTLDLARNKIPSLGTKLFENLDYLENLNLAENQITKIDRVAFKNLQFININMSYNQIATFQNDSFINVIDITVLDLSHNNITTMGEGVFQGDKSYMRELNLQYNNITNLGDIDLNFRKIKILNVTHNQIEVIPRGTFPTLYELETIDVSHNHINEVAGSVFGRLFSIRSINMSHNKLENLAKGPFGSLTTLLEVDISHNLLSEVSWGLFGSLVSLRRLHLNNNNLNKFFQIPQGLNYLYLHHNNISSIPANTWPVMNALLHMNLDHNKLGDNLKSGSFRNLNSLRTLSLNNNSINIPPWQALGEMQTLQYLNLEYNNLENITRGAFGRLPIVFELNLAHNGMKNISKQAFDGLLQLLKLNLSHNALEHIPNEAFRGCVSMQTIDLSHNYLRKIDNDTNGLLDDLLSIKNINVSHNHFGTVSKKMFPYHKWIPYNVHNVDLSYNRLPVLYKNLLIGLQKVKVLNISHNILNEIRPNVIGNLTKLEVLDLSFNELEALGNTVFRKGGALREVHLQNNTLISLPANILMSNTNLTFLDVRHNNLHHYYEEFVPRVVNGTTIRFQENPVECDCMMRRIRAWLDTWLDSKSWNDIICQSPAHLSNRSLKDISEGELRCNDDRRAREEYQVHPDVRFRIHGEKGDEMEKLDVSWYVTTNEDIGGFVLSVHNTSSGQEVSRHSLDYTARRQKYQDVPRGRYRVCVAALDSIQEIRPIQASQCHSFKVNNAKISVISPILILMMIFSSLLIT